MGQPFGLAPAIPRGRCQNRVSYAETSALWRCKDAGSGRTRGGNVRILVIGSSGFVGRHVVPKLLDKGEEIVGFDVRPEPHDLGGPANVESGMLFVQGDMANGDEVMAALVDHKIEQVIVLGYLMAPLMSPEFVDFVGAVRTNLLGITYILEACSQAGVERVIFSSTVGVYGPQSDYGDRPITEDDRPAAGGLYGRMKMVNETIADKYREVYGIEVVKVRPSPILGVGNTMWPSRLISPAAVGEPGHAPFSSSGRNNLVGIEDLAELYHRISAARELKHDTYLASGHNFLVEELVTIVRSLLPSAELHFDEDAPPPPYPTIFDNTRAVEEFDWKLQPLEESVLAHVNAERARAGNLPALTLP